MADPKIVVEWTQKADEDFYFAMSNLKENSNFFAQICFHFHQSAEKYLKSFIIAYDLEFEKTHNLIKLLNACSSKKSSILSLMPECERLNTAYIDTRYPVHWPVNYTKGRALKMSEDTRKIRNIIMDFLSELGINPTADAPKKL